MPGGGYRWLVHTVGEGGTGYMTEPALGNSKFASRSDGSHFGGCLGGQVAVVR